VCGGSQMLPERGYRWNFVVMGLDIAFFTLALSFISLYGVLPLFVHHLTGSNVAVGLVATMQAVGFQVAPVFVAGLTERRRRRKPLFMALTLFERLPYLALALLIVPLATAHPTLLLWIFFALIAASSVAGGMATPAWGDLIGRMTPANWRGRFFGLSSAVGGLLAVAGGALATELLLRFPWPANFALCFGCACLFMAVSFGVLTLGREPLPAEQPPLVSPRGYWLGLPRILRADRTLRVYLLASAFVTVGGMASSFYTVAVQQTLRLTDAAAGLYVLLLLASTTVGSALWGYLGDHIGHKRVVEWGAFCMGLAALLALAGQAPSVAGPAYVAVFLGLGLGSSAIQLTGMTFLMELAPPTQRPTYMALAGLAGTPFACGAPLLGGALADHWGYAAVFGPAGVCALAGGLLMARSVPDPRAEDRAAPR